MPSIGVVHSLVVSPSEEYVLSSTSTNQLFLLKLPSAMESDPSATQHIIQSDTPPVNSGSAGAMETSKVRK